MRETDGGPSDSKAQPQSSPARSRLVQVPIRSSASILQPPHQSPPPSSATLLTTPIPSSGPNRPPYRFRRDTDSTIRNDASQPNPQSLYSSRPQPSVRRLTSPIVRPITSTGSRLKSRILSALWTMNPTPPLRRLHLNDDHSSHLKRLMNTCSSHLGIRKPAFWFILIMIMGICDLWRSADRKLDNQDWGPTRFRTGRRTAAETRRLQLQMRQYPFQTLAELGVLANSNSSSVDPFGLTGRWLRPPERSTIPLANRGHVQPDVTAVLLNWNRLENLIVIVAHLCQYDFFESIIIWNNSPKQILSHKDFQYTKCPSHKLSIFNSPTNNYFVSRFLACLQSRTKFCYFQDDDCIVNIIRTMYFQFKSLQNQQLDEDDKKLSLVVQADPVYSVMYNWEWCFNDRSNGLNACFAWLGHGSFLTKTAVLEFLSLVSSGSSLPSDSVALADNFFTTSLNRQPNVIVVPEIIGLPLSDSGFSDGNSGLERNRVYIQRGVEKISKLLKNGQGPKSSSSSQGEAQTASNKVIIRAVERGDRIHFITNVEPFPGERPDFKGFDHGLAGWEDQLGTTGYQLGRVRPRNRLHSTREDWERRELETINSSFAAATDGDPSTSWISPQPVQKDDWVGLGWIDKPVIDSKTEAIEIHFMTTIPEVFQGDQAIEILTSTNNATLIWEKLPSPMQTNFQQFHCSPSDSQFDCLVRFHASFLGFLQKSLALRFRLSSVLPPVRWSVSEAFVLAVL